MKSFRQHPAKVNTGSMADIAFLLLIFFLVSTTISAEKGLLRKLPAYCENPAQCETDIKRRNLLEITLNRNNEILISSQRAQLYDVTNTVVAFVDNNGLGQCHYCSGQQSTDYSEHPLKAAILLRYDAKSRYDHFVAVQDKISLAYDQLRENYAKTHFNTPMEKLDGTRLNLVKAKYPIKLSEVKIE
ncbi:ExbD/TolR family protein [uncultured Winogradskyella sp.]|uniref:ExbD/TolR family protein n=1 Tax=uncultured Winogradskyella sp. TaxID=395353 RepID=UPI003519441E